MIKKKDVTIGAHYAIKHTSTQRGKLSIVKVIRELSYGGWECLNLSTGRKIRVKGNTKFRYEVMLNPKFPEENPKWLKVG